MSRTFDNFPPRNGSGGGLPAWGAWAPARPTPPGNGYTNGRGASSFQSGKYQKEFAGVTLGGAADTPPRPPAGPPPAGVDPTHPSALHGLLLGGETRAVSVDSLAGLVLGEHNPPPPPPPPPAPPVGFTIDNIVKKMNAQPSLPPGVRPPPSSAANTTANASRKATSVCWEDARDGAEIDFCPLESGACYSVNGETRPVIREAFFGKDAQGYYVEFPAIEHSIALHSTQAPTVVRCLKTMFDACGVSHNLHKRKAPPAPAPAPAPVSTPAKPVAAPAPQAAVPKPAPAKEEKMPVPAPAAPPVETTKPAAPEPAPAVADAAPTPSAIEHDSSVLYVFTNPPKLDEDAAAKSVPKTKTKVIGMASKKSAPADEEAAAGWNGKAVMKEAKQTALERAKEFEKLYTHKPATGKEEPEPKESRGHRSGKATMSITVKKSPSDNAGNDARRSDRGDKPARGGKGGKGGREGERREHNRGGGGGAKEGKVKMMRVKEKA